MDEATRNRLSRHGVQQLPSPEKLKMLRERLERVRRPKDMSEQEFQDKLKWIRTDLETLDPSWPPSEELDWNKELDVMLGELSEMKYHAATRLAFNQQILFQGDVSGEDQQGGSRQVAVQRFVKKAGNTLFKGFSWVVECPFRCYSSVEFRLKTWQKVMQFFLLVFFIVLPWPFLDPAWGINWPIWGLAPLLLGFLVIQMMLWILARVMKFQAHHQSDGSPKNWFIILALIYNSTLYFSICYSMAAIVALLQ